MKKTLILPMVLLILNFASAGPTEDKKKLMSFCTSLPGATQTSCSCTINGWKKNLSAKAWKSLLYAAEPTSIIALGKEGAARVVNDFKQSESVIRKISADCIANK